MAPTSQSNSVPRADQLAFSNATVPCPSSAHGPSMARLLASSLMSDAGRKVISVAALISTYGYLAASFVSAPRLPYALAVEGDCPPILATLHPRSDTPVYAIVGFAIVGCALAISGTFRWALALSAGSMTVVYTGICAALIRLRRKRPAADALRIPFGTIVAIVGIAF